MIKQILTLAPLLLLINTAFAAQGQSCSDYIPDKTPVSRYIVDTDKGTVTDTETGLMWQQCSLGLSGVNCTTGSATILNWQAALNAGPISSAGGFSDWRLPNRNELLSIVALNCANPSVNQAVFPNTQPAFGYWSSSPNADRNDHAWYVSFNEGDGNYRPRNQSRYVRLVR